MSDYRREEAINETRARQTNEWIEEANDKFGGNHPMDEYRCECSDGGCAPQWSVSPASSTKMCGPTGSASSSPPTTRTPSSTVLVAAHERYSIVAKLPGEPARIALDSDPRKN